jgi:hypothetical protein
MMILLNPALRHWSLGRCAVFASCLLSTAFVVASSSATDTNSTKAAPAPAVGAAAGFHHPGVLLNQLQLDLIKTRVAAGTEPQKSAFEAAKASTLGALSYTPQA